MKNFKKFIALTACMLLCLMFFTACGGSSEYEGTWKATTAYGEEDGNKVEVNISDYYDDFTITLNAGGKATMSFNGNENEGSWKEADNGITLDNGSDEMSFTNDGGKLVIEQSGVQIVFEKQ